MDMTAFDLIVFEMAPMGMGERERYRETKNETKMKTAQSNQNTS
jgi:hypothetical protein